MTQAWDKACHTWDLYCAYGAVTWLVTACRLKGVSVPVTADRATRLDCGQHSRWEAAPSQGLPAGTGTFHQLTSCNAALSLLCLVDLTYGRT